MRDSDYDRAARAREYERILAELPESDHALFALYKELMEREAEGKLPRLRVYRGPEDDGLQVV